MENKENTKGLEIFKALENTDDDLLEKCENYSASKIKVKSKWFAAAAAAVFICAIGIGIHFMKSDNGIKTSGSESIEDIAVISSTAASSHEDTEESTTVMNDVGEKTTKKSTGNNLSALNQNAGSGNTKQTEIAATSTYPTESQDLYEIPQWDEMNLAEQFSGFERDGNSYLVNSGVTIDKSRIMGKLGDVTLTGYDVYTDKEYSANAELYSISKISDNYMAAIKYEGCEDFYPCENLDYHPADLQQLINDANLREELTFNGIYYSYFDDELNNYNVNYSVDNSDVFWTELFDKVGNPQAINAEDIPDEFFNDYDFMYDSKLIDRGIGLNDKGYIITNIPVTGSAFYIGEENVKAFADYIDKNFSKEVEVFPAEPFDDSGEDDYISSQTATAVTVENIPE